MPFDIDTYSAGVHFNAAVTPTDVFVIGGSANRVVLVQQIRVSGLAGTAGAVNLNVIKRSSANSGGTSSALTKVPHNSLNAAASASVVNYTVNPASLGNSLGNVRVERLTLPLAGTASAGVTFDFGVRGGIPVALLNANEFLCLNCGGGAPLATAFSIYAEWTEL